MKIIFYKRLIADDFGLTASERIVYSFMLSRAVLSIDCVFDPQGETLQKEIIEEYEQLENGFIDLPFEWFNEHGNPQCGRKISKSTGIALSAVQYSLKTLDNIGLIDLSKRGIYMGDVWRSGYFELLKGKNKKLRGELLIFYSWICDYSKITNNIVSASVDRIAKKYNTSKVAMRDLIHRLHKLNLAERLDNGKLLIK